MNKCVNALYGLRINNDGSCSHCCMQKGHFKKLGKKLNVRTDSFKNITESSDSKKIREDLENGIKNAACQYCWKEEAAGKVSKRLRDNKTYSYLLEKKYDGPRLFDISMGTTCNIKCRTCGPFNSSLWNDEWKDAGYFKGSDEKYKTFILEHNHSFDDDSLFWEEFKNNLHNIEHIDFYGGEPFLVKKQWEIMQYAIDKGVAKNITVHYNTNGTIWDDKKFDVLDKFKKVYIDFSIDGIYDQLTYIRYPADWNTVLQNFLKVLEISKKDDKFHCSICCTVSTLNIFYIDEIMKFFNDYTKNLYLNLVHGPTHLCIVNIPTNIKKIITEKILQSVNPELSGYYFVNGVLEFMNNSECDIKYWNEFLRTTAWHDEYRKQNFKETFNEFYKIIKENEYDVSMEK